jgi:hypothetical protein
MNESNIGTPTSNTQYTISVWVKRASLGTQNILSSYRSGNEDTELLFDSSDRIEWRNRISGSYSSGGGWQKTSTKKLRDTNGWYHIVAQRDGANAKIFVNGEEVTYGTNNQSAGDSCWNTDHDPMSIGTANLASVSRYFDGSMSHFHFCDGNVYAPTVFGSTDSTTGEWKINTSPSITMGTNGFTILKDGNTITDQSSNSNNFTLGGGTLTKTEDCPSNVFATLNPLEYSPNPATLDNGNTTYNKSSTGSGHNATATGTIGAMTGKWYYEFKPTNTTAFVTGMVRTNHVLPDAEGYFGNDAGGYGVTKTGRMVAGSESSVTGLSIGANDIVGLAFDLDNGKFYVHVNGTYMLSGDPTSGSTGTGSLGNIALGSNIYVPYVANANYGATNLQYFNFGNGYFGTTAVASAGTNASGIGIFEYDVPTGYTALSTKGLNE